MKRRNDPCTDPKNGYLDLTEHDLPPEQRLESGVYGDDRDGPTTDEEQDEQHELPAMKRYRVKAPEIPAHPIPHRRTERSLEDMFQDMEDGNGREQRQEDHEDVAQQRERASRRKRTK